MKQIKKTLFILFSAGLITVMTSCAAHRGTGCPSWSKVKERLLPFS